MLMPRGLCRPRRRIRMVDFRVEKDFLGEVKVPKDAYWGVQTQRAIENFPISGIRFGRRFIYALGLIKMACAQTNVELCLLDATTIGLGQEFSGYQSQIDHGIRRVSAARAALAELAIGGTAVGTGINAHPDLPGRVVEKISAATNTKFRVAENHFEAQAARDALVEASGAIRTVAISMIKIANDLRWLGSGPHTGLRELNLPAVQPGSSIMPGKVNPVIPEAVMQVGVTVIGNDVAIAVANTHSNLDLSTMMPVMSQRIQQNIELLANVARVSAHRCIDGITANVEVLRRYAESSPAIATKLNPIIGYEKAAEIAKEAGETGKTVKQLVIEKGILSPEEAEKVLDPRHLTSPSKDLLGGGSGSAPPMSTGTS